MTRAGYIVSLLFALLQIGFVGTTNDTNMLLHASAHMVYDGGLYHRWFTVNSPVFYAIYAVPVMASVWLNLPDAMALHGFTALCCALSLLAAKCLLRAARVDER